MKEKNMQRHQIYKKVVFYKSNLVTNGSNTRQNKKRYMPRSFVRKDRLFYSLPLLEHVQTKFLSYFTEIIREYFGQQNYIQIFICIN